MYRALLLIGGAALFALPASPSDARTPRKRQIGWSTSIGGETFRIWGGVKTGLMPKGVSISPDGKTLFVANFGRKGRHNLDFYDVPSLTRRRTMSFVGNAIETLASPDSKMLYVSNFYGNRLHWIDPFRLKIRRTIRTGGMPKWMALSPDGRTLYAARWTGGGIVSVDTRTGRKLGRLRTGRHPRGISVSRDGKTLYVANTGGRSVVVVDASDPARLRRVRRIPTGKFPRHTALTKDGRYLYLSILGGGLLQKVDLVRGRVIKTKYVGRMPRTIGLSSDEKYVYIAAYADHGMTIIDVSSSRWDRRRVPLDIVKASGLAVHPADKWIYVTGWCSNDVWAIERIKPGEVPGMLGSKPKRSSHSRRNNVRPFSLGCK